MSKIQLGGKAITDQEFDHVFEPWVRTHSDTHWTPLAAATRAVEWLELSQGQRVLDVGSGCGKFCLAGALSSPAHFVGVERRIALVRVAEQAAKSLSVERVTFVHADFPLLPWDDFDAFYFFNPFAEYLYAEGSVCVVDDKMAGQHWRYVNAVKITKARLAALPVGARVVCYNGYGGRMPANYHVKQSELINDCHLRLWVKEARSRTTVPSGPVVL